QGPREVDHPAVLGLLAHLTEARVVAVLLAAARVEAGRKEVAIGGRADPDLGPGRRNDQRFDPAERLFIAHGFAVGIDVGEPRPDLFAADARGFIADILQRDCGRSLLGIHRRMRGDLYLFLWTPRR